MRTNCQNCQRQMHEDGCQKKYDAKRCYDFIPRQGWSLAELALINPSGLNAALKEMPFDVQLNFHLR